jgi:hypothetical protein
VEYQSDVLLISLVVACVWGTKGVITKVKNMRVCVMPGLCS